MKNCLILLKEKRHDIREASIDLFTQKEAQFQELSAKLKVGDIPEEDLTIRLYGLNLGSSRRGSLRVSIPLGTNLHRSTLGLLLTFELRLNLSLSRHQKSVLLICLQQAPRVRS